MCTLFVNVCKGMIIASQNAIAAKLDASPGTCTEEEEEEQRKY